MYRPKTWTSFSVDVLGAVDLETANFTVTFVTFGQIFIIPL